MAVLGRSGKSDHAGSFFNTSDLIGRFSVLQTVIGSKSAPRVVEIVLAILIAIVLAKLFISLFAPLPLPKGEVVASVPSAAPAAAVIVKSPFPAVAVELAPVIEPTEDVAETSLDLTLKGATVWPSQEGASATIRTPDGQQKRFGIGDTIVPGVTLEAVYADQAIINSNGVRESLRFESKMTVDTLVDEPQEPIRPHGRRDPDAPPTSVTSESIGRLSSVLRVAPGMNSSGELVVELYAARDRSSFSALGFEDGDRLVSINGAPAPTNPVALSDALNRIQQEENVAVVVERNGEDIPLRISLPDLFGN